jgi:DNA adenine methylase
MRTTTKTTLPVVKPQLRTPISYYGGKQSMLKEILPLIPQHRIYTEVFFGGGAVFWAKQPTEVEVINDLNAEVVNFYKQAKSNFSELKKLIDVSLHSRDIYADAMHIYKRPHLFSELYRAWAFWVTTNQGFSTMIGTWGYTNNNKSPLKNANKRIAFDEQICKRLDAVQVECNDAIKILKARNKEDAFHYIDPPYIEVHQGHYAGYLRSDFEDLLKTCEQIKGKFLLSTYPTDILAEYTKMNDWYTVEISKPLCASKVTDGAKRKYKIEVLTANYEI